MPGLRKGDYPIVAKKTALILFDFDNDFLKPGAPLEVAECREVLLPRIKPLINLCRSRGVLVVYANHAHRKDGSDAGVMDYFYPSIRERRTLLKDTPGTQVYDEIKPQEGDVVVEKHRYSAFFATDLEMILRNRGVDTVIICGGGINMGCDATARDATCRDFKVIFPSDGNLGHDMPDLGCGPVSKEDVARVTLTTMAYGFARVVTIAEIMKELK